MSEGQAIAMQYPESALPAVQLAIMAVVVTAVLATWLILVFLAAREPRGKAGAVDRRHRDEETAATVTGLLWQRARRKGSGLIRHDAVRPHVPTGPQVIVTAQSRCIYTEDTMKLIVYGDFNCPYSYLASQRASQLIRGGMAQVEWRAVEHDRRLALTGTSSAVGRGTWERELAEVAALALPGEHAPAAPPPVVSNTRAAVAAYAEAVSDEIAAELRRRLFRAIWAEGRHLSSAYEVRRLVTGLMWPQEDIGDRLTSPDIPGLLVRDPGSRPDHAQVRWHDRPGRRAAHHGWVAADPPVAGGLARVAQPGHPRRHRPGPGPAVRR